MRRRLHSHFQTCLGDNLRFPEISNSERPLGFGHWPLAYQFEANYIPEPIANNVYELRNTGALVHYLHKALFSPTKSALLQEVKDGHLITWPGLTEDAIHKYLKHEPETPKHKVHLKNADCGRTNTGHRLGHKNPPRVSRPG
jgi:hypothetical protein